VCAMQLEPKDRAQLQHMMGILDTLATQWSSEVQAKIGGRALPLADRHQLQLPPADVLLGHRLMGCPYATSVPLGTRN
jgi:hypothetical protein